MRLTHRGERWLRACGVAAALGMTTVAAQGQLEPGAAKSQSPSGPAEGITVHGHWKIVVRNPDGLIASSREFENALTQQGKALLLTFLSTNNRSVGVADRWGVTLAGPNGPCAGSTACLIEEGDQQQPGVSLTRRATAGFLELSGSAKITSTGNPSGISLVGTQVSLCDFTVTDPAQCHLGVSDSRVPCHFQQRPWVLTVNVTFGQIVQFTVTFTIS